MAGTTRLELATSAVTGRRSNQLSYVPLTTRMPAEGFDDPTCGNHSFECIRREGFEWSAAGRIFPAGLRLLLDLHHQAGDGVSGGDKHLVGQAGGDVGHLARLQRLTCAALDR